MTSDRVAHGVTEKIMTTVLTAAGVGYTGLTDVKLEIRQKSTSKYFDFSDSTFKTSGWTTRQGAMTELDSTNSPGVYYYNFDTTPHSSRYVEEEYFIRAASTVAGGVPNEGGLRVGGFVDQIGVFEGGGRGGYDGMTRQQMIGLAKMVWEVILKGKETAKEVLLSKSEFDAAKDKVMLKEKINVKPIVVQQKAAVAAQKDYTREMKQLLIAIKRIKMEKPANYAAEFIKLEKLVMTMPDKMVPVLDKIRSGIRDIQNAKDDYHRQTEIAKSTTIQVTKLMDQMNVVAEEMKKIPDAVAQEVLPTLDKRFKEQPTEIL